jgi:hypothetical protein
VQKGSLSGVGSGVVPVANRRAPRASRSALTSDGAARATKEVREHGTFGYIDTSLATPYMNAFLGVPSGPCTQRAIPSAAAGTSLKARVIDRGQGKQTRRWWSKLREWLGRHAPLSSEGRDR